RHPERWRKDAAGNIVCKRFCNCKGCLCFEYDHIVPFSRGGESTAENCQILQTRVNRLKSNKEVDTTRLQGYSCAVQFTAHGASGITGIFLSAASSTTCLLICSTTFLSLPQKPPLYKSEKRKCGLGVDKELDIIEMAVYGDVSRPGNQCRCRTLAEMLGKYKSKDDLAACKLPYDKESLQQTKATY
ncbi:HNH endonuclease domain-containing protein isoform 2, partial [Theobroma cacao]